MTIRGERQYRWRAVDQDGDVIDILLQPRRDRHAAARFCRTLLKRSGRVPHRVVTDRLGSDRAAHRVIMPSVVHDGTTRYPTTGPKSHTSRRVGASATCGASIGGTGPEVPRAERRIARRGLANVELCAPR